MSNVHSPMSITESRRERWTSRFKHLSDVGLWTLGFGLFFRRFDEDLNASCGWQATDDLRSVDLGHLGTGCVPEFHPESSGVAVDRESGSVVHYGNRLGGRAVAQFL